jgi:8-oxo-dGTP pyrophosphatase MutT (NUDIX family)
VNETRPAAVLIPIVERAESMILLAQRTSKLSSHPGQVAFPGGKMGLTDVSPLTAAMREAEEEFGLDRRFVDLIGCLDLYFAFSGFRILPAVARVTPGYSLALNASQVVDVFEVPLAFLMTPTNHQFFKGDWKGIDVRYYDALPEALHRGFDRRFSAEHV